MKMTFLQAAYELHRRYILLAAAEEIEDAIADGPDEDTLRLRLGGTLVELIESVQRHGLFEYDPGLLEPTRPMFGADNARNRRYVHDGEPDSTEPGSYRSRTVVALEMLGMADATDEEALEALPVIEMLAEQITNGGRLTWLGQCDPQLDLAPADDPLRARFAVGAERVMSLLRTTRVAPPADIERIGAAFMFGAAAGWAYANEHMDDVVGQIAEQLGRRPTEHEVTRAVGALGIGIAYQRLRDH